MSSAFETNSHRPLGPMRIIDFPERPICPFCSKKMVVRDTSKPRPIIDLLENAYFRVKYYRCNTMNCPGLKQPYLAPSNPYVAPKNDFSYIVQVKITDLRWNHHKTYHEIIKTMKTDYDIHLSLNTIENILKIYEIGCSQRYRQDFLDKIKYNGGIILTIDGMAPMKGNKSLYVVFDYQTGLTLGSERLPNQKAETIIAFLRRVKKRIDEELGVKVKGIISDALPSQRIAIKAVFPDVPHCLCHYHFYELVLKAPKEADSALLTQIRSKLRKLYDLRKFQEKISLKIKEPFSCELLNEIMKILNALSNWTRKPRDPCFSGLTLFSRLSDIFEKVEKMKEIIESGQLRCKEEKMIFRLYRDIKSILEENKDNSKDLIRINDHLQKTKGILGNLDLEFSQGLYQLRKLRDQFRERSRAKNCRSIEQNYIEAFRKFIRTKIEHLFNYKKVEGAPTTNNSHELQFKQLKHFLRRVIGFSAAKRYLLTHGERIVFVNLDENFEGILEILQNTDFSEARKLIRKERIGRDALRLIMHVNEKWDEKMDKINEMLKQYQVPLLIIN